MKDQIEERSSQLLRNSEVMGHGFESRSSPPVNFFQAFFLQMLEVRNNCMDLPSKVIYRLFHSCFQFCVKLVYILSPDNKI